MGLSGTTPHLGLPYPTSTDLVSNGPSVIQSLATALDAAALYQQGTYAARPATIPASGNLYYATDTGQLFVSNGTAWVAVDPVDAAAGTASMRTLGTGSQQAAAGSHAAQHAAGGVDKLYTAGTVTFTTDGTGAGTVSVAHGLGVTPSGASAHGVGVSFSTTIAISITSTNLAFGIGGGGGTPNTSYTLAWVALR